MFDLLNPLDRHQAILDAIEKKKAQLSDCLSYRPIPDPRNGKGHLGRVIQRLEQEIADLEEEDRKLLLHAAQRKLLLNSAEDLPHASPAGEKGTSAGGSRHRPVDPRKELIARLKAHNLSPTARKICELIDQYIDQQAPILRKNFAPLESWQRTTLGKRSWVDVYDHPATRNLVRTYVNRVPRLKTSK